MKFNVVVFSYVLIRVPWCVTYFLHKISMDSHVESELQHWWYQMHVDFYIHESSMDSYVESELKFCLL
jgi:hypothetical protein